MSDREKASYILIGVVFFTIAAYILSFGYVALSDINDHQKTEEAAYKN